MPCKIHYSMCATGISAGALVPTNYFCELDIPSGGLPTGSGSYCYDSSQNCLNGCAMRRCVVLPPAATTVRSKLSAAPSGENCCSDPV